MATDLGMEAIQVEFRATKVTLEALMSIFNKLVHKQYTPVHGEQSVRKLTQQGAKLTTYDVDPAVSQELRKNLRKLGVDFYIDRKAGTMNEDGTKNYTLYLKAKDVDIIKKALEQIIQKRTVENISHDAETRAQQKNAERAQERQHADPNRSNDLR